MIQIQRVFKGIDVPRYATPGSAAVDLQAAINAPITIHPGHHVAIPTGLKIFIDNPTIVGEIVPRSGKGLKGYGLKNLVGVIDSDYQGEIVVIVWNTNRQSALDDNSIRIEPLDRIAQLLFKPVLQVQFNEVESFSDTTSRGEGGFGSTDTPIELTDWYIADECIHGNTPYGRIHAAILDKWLSPADDAWYVRCAGATFKLGTQASNDEAKPST